MVNKSIRCIILAAGKGTRMNSQVPKILHEIFGLKMINYVINLSKSIHSDKTVIVLGYKNSVVKDALSKEKIEFVIQKELLGSGDAVNESKDEFTDFDGDVVVLYGDTPLIRPETLTGLIKTHQDSKNVCTILTTFLKDPTGYGRIVRNSDGKVVKIVEEVDASIFDKTIEEINVGVYCFKSKELFKALGLVQNKNKKNEYFLTDTIDIFSKSNKLIGTFSTKDTDEIIGVNSRVDLARAEEVLRKRVLKRLMLKGVTIKDPHTISISDDVEIGTDTIIYPGTIIENNVKIGKNCKIGPFARIRPGTTVGENSEIGNFVEINRSEIGNDTKIKHLSYLGDAEVGNNVNIGAGTIVANYDGKVKSRTIIKDGAFIGSGTILIAPCKIGKRAITGAGAVVTKNSDVGDDKIVVGIPARVLKKINSNIKNQISK